MCSLCRCTLILYVNIVCIVGIVKYVFIAGGVVYMYVCFLSIVGIVMCLVVVMLCICCMCMCTCA